LYTKMIRAKRDKDSAVIAKSDYDQKFEYSRQMLDGAE